LEYWNNVKRGKPLKKHEMMSQWNDWERYGETGEIGPKGRDFISLNLCISVF
jgi:hypothetical protein